MHLRYFALLLLFTRHPKDVLSSEITTIGNACNSATDTCTTTPVSVCDTTTRTCRIQVGLSCASPNGENCVTGTSCDTGDLCKLKVLESCALLNSVNCKTGLTCDTTDNKCRVDVLQSCAGTNATNCKNGLACDTIDNKCRVDVLQSCAGANATKCKTDLACDVTDNKCRYKASSVCTTGIDRCVSGAACTSISDTCTCNSAAYTPTISTGLCEAISKKVGGSCTAGARACDDPNASCTNSKCQCNFGYQVKLADATCSGCLRLVASIFLLFGAFLVRTFV